MINKRVLSEVWNRYNSVSNNSQNQYIISNQQNNKKGIKYAKQYQDSRQKETLVIGTNRLRIYLYKDQKQLVKKEELK